MILDIKCWINIKWMTLITLQTGATTSVSQLCASLFSVPWKHFPFLKLVFSLCSIFAKCCTRVVKLILNVLCFVYLSSQGHLIIFSVLFWDSTSSSGSWSFSQHNISLKIISKRSGLFEHLFLSSLTLRADDSRRKLCRRLLAADSFVMLALTQRHLAARALQAAHRHLRHIAAVPVPGFLRFRV